MPHSWSYVGDVAATLVAAAHDDRSWGRAWHAPAATASAGGLTERFAKLARSPAPRPERLDRGALASPAVSTPVLGELIEMLYATEHPHILDSTETRRVLGLSPADLDAALLDTVRGLEG